MSMLTIVAVVGIVIYVVSRQVLGEPLRGERLLTLPPILAAVGVIDLAEHGHRPGSSDIVLIVLGLLVAATIGVKRGLSMRRFVTGCQP